MQRTKLLLLAAMLLGCLRVSAAPAHEYVINGIYYSRVVGSAGSTWVTGSTSAGSSSLGVMYSMRAWDEVTNEYSGDVVIPSTVNHNGFKYTVVMIWNSAFRGCTTLTSVTLPSTIVQISSWAFLDCTGLTSVIIPEDSQLMYINSGAFDGCTNLTSMVIPKATINIGDEAFYGCTNLTSITIPESVTHIGYKALEGTAWYDNLPDGEVYINNVFYRYKGDMPENSTIEIREGTVSISPGAFEGCANLSSIIIPKSVTSIGDNAFIGCTGLKNVVFEDSYTACSLGKNGSASGLFTPCPLESFYMGRDLSYSGNYSPLYNCTQLETVAISDSVMDLGAYLFRNCSSLTSITLPESVTSIGSGAFWGCSSLTTINIPEGVTSIGSEAFRDCNSLERVTINCVNVSNWFKSRTSIKEVILGNSVETIGESAFSGCTGMSDLTIGSSVATIGQKAFADCSNLMNIYALNPKAITCNENIFHTDAYNNATLYVPEGREQAYAKTTPWMKFYIQTLVVPEKSHSVTIGTAGYATLYLDYAVERPRGVEAYYVSRVSGDVAVLKAVWDYIPAHTGVILRGSAGTYTFAYTAAQVQSIPQNMLRGTTVDTEIPAEPGITYYALGRSDGVVGLYAGKIVDGCFFNNANKAYLPLPSDEGAGDTEQLARGLYLSFPENTGVETMESAPETPTLIYDLQGRRLTAITERGIYIVNGKKVVR